MKELEKLKSQQEKVQKEIEQLQNRQKILLNRKTDTERRARTRRLIEHGAILESIFPAAAAMTGEEAKAFLLALSRLPGQGKPPQIYANPGMFPKSLGYKGALMHRSGACALPGALRPPDAMGIYTPQTPCALRWKRHPLCGCHFRQSLIYSIPEGGETPWQSSIAPSRSSSAARASPPWLPPHTGAAQSSPISGTG